MREAKFNKIQYIIGVSSILLVVILVALLVTGEASANCNFVFMLRLQLFRLRLWCF